jgi:CRP-like cAMP-binding protein
VSNIVPLLMPLKVEESEFLYHHDQFPYEIFFLIKGKINFINEKDELILKQWNQNSYFGDIEIYIASKRLCSCKAFESSDLFILNKKYCFDIIEKEFPGIDTIL